MSEQETLRDGHWIDAIGALELIDSALYDFEIQYNKLKRSGSVASIGEFALRPAMRGSSIRTMQLIKQVGRIAPGGQYISSLSAGMNVAFRAVQPIKGLGSTFFAEKIADVCEVVLETSQVIKPAITIRSYSRPLCRSYVRYEAFLDPSIPSRSEQATDFGAGFHAVVGVAFSELIDINTEIAMSQLTAEELRIEHIAGVAERIVSGFNEQ